MLKPQYNSVYVCLHSYYIILYHMYYVMYAYHMICMSYTSYKKSHISCIISFHRASHFQSLCLESAGSASTLAVAGSMRRSMCKAFSRV